MPKPSLKILKTKDFEKSFEKLPQNIQLLAVKKIVLFKANQFNPCLKTHKLKGELQNFYSFSVNYQYRILFEFLDKNKNEALFYDVGTHEIYK